MTTSQNDEKPTPAQLLSGRELPGGWKVDELLEPPSGFSGGRNSTTYSVHSKQKGKAFLKAFDFSRALIIPNIAIKMQRITEEYQYERKILELCNSKNMDRVVRLLDEGEFYLDPSDSHSAVLYLVLERADNDIRPYLSLPTNKRIGWVLRAMHEVSVGLEQLHGAHIAHQDIKPGNILMFENTGVKIGDLGRSSHRYIPSPFDSWQFAGDSLYAPPEILYGDISSDWDSRRINSDLYMLGSLITYMSVGRPINDLIFENIDRAYWPPIWFRGRSGWPGTYEEISPYIYNIFLQTVHSINNSIHTEVASDLTEIIEELCHPDPEERARTMNRGVGRYSLQKVISKFNLLYKRNQLSSRHNEPIRRETKK